MRAVPAWSVALALAIAVSVSAPLAHAQESVRVTAYGNVDRPGEISLQGKPHLSDAVVAAQVNRSAYILGAAWLRHDLTDQQVRLKAGLLYQLGWIARTATDKRGSEPLSSLARRMHDWIEAMPVTGRQIVRTLEPHILQTDGPDNLMVTDGDQLIYPTRPASVSVVGALAQNCQMPFVALQDVRAYVVQCAKSRYSDPDWVWVIEPDGNVSKVGLSLWNRTPVQTVAPGAILYVPIKQATVAGEIKQAILASDADEELNRDMVAFLATQPVGGSGANP